MNKISEKSVTKYKAFSTLLHKKTDKICRLIPIKNFINKLKIGEQINELFPTEKTNADKKGAKSYHPLLAFVSSPYGIM